MNGSFFFKRRSAVLGKSQEWQTSQGRVLATHKWVACVSVILSPTQEIARLGRDMSLGLLHPHLTIY